MSFLRRAREQKARMERVDRELDEQQAQIEEQDHQVRSLIGWLEANKLHSGFVDFEWMVATRGGRR